MAEQIISPGVFTRENDLSFLPQGVGAIGAAIVGPTVKGPAFVPTVVRSFAEYERRFGGLSSDTFIPQTVREYLKNAGSVTVCRVLAGGGYTYTNGTNSIIVIAASGSANASNVALGVVFPSKSTGTADLGLTTIAGPSGPHGQIDEDFSITLKGATGGVAFSSGTQLSASLKPSAQNYLFKQLGNNPNNSKSTTTTYGATGATPGYTYNNWKTLQQNIQNASQKEVATITFMSDINTSSLSNAALGASGSFYLATTDGVFHTVGFASSSAEVPISGISGSVSVAVSNNGQVDGMISGSTLATNMATAISLLTGVSATSSGRSVTITHDTAGHAVDVSTTFTSGTASISTTTQGADLSGYKGISADRDIILVSQSADIAFNGGIGQFEGYGYASTPWIKSQFLDAAKTTKELFKFHTISHGTLCNTDYKISIANLKEPSDIDNEEQYSQFSVLVRKYSDNDKEGTSLEQFNGVTLDPDSPRFISRIIGDRYPQYNDTLDKVELLGDYPNVSEYVRVEVNELVGAKAYSPKYSPKGFAALYNPIPTASLNFDVTIPSASYEGTQVVGTNFSSRGYLGWKTFEKAQDNYNWIKPLPTILESNVAGDFNVENYHGHADSAYTGSLSSSLSSSAITNSQLKFTIPFQGGDDGISPQTVRVTGNESPKSFVTGYTTGANLYGFDVNSTNDAGYKGYSKAINILSNQDEYDINMLAMPGVNYATHPLLANKGIDMCEERGDCFFVMDLNTIDASVNTAIQNVDGLDTNYAAVYYPWVKVLDTAANKPVMVPPSVIVPGAIAQSDRIAAEWFAPAGLNRGVLGNVIEAKIRLNQGERDKLYDAKINPIATFPQTGVCIWGQKTLQERSTALDRINVRRLLIALKKFIASSSKYLVFEQNTDKTRTRFLNIVNPYLESVQQKQGLYAFRVQMDESNNTPDVIDRNQLVGGIYLQPTKTAEFIVLDFNVLPTGATFPS